MGNDDFGRRLDNAILGITTVVSEESARTRRELHDAIAGVRNDLTDFMRTSSVDTATFRAELDALKAAPSEEEKRAITRRDVALFVAGGSAVIFVIIALYNSVPVITEAVLKAALR